MPVKLLMSLINVFRKVNVGQINRNPIGARICGMLLINDKLARDYGDGPLIFRLSIRCFPCQIF